MQMTGHTRRNFLKVSGAALGGIAVGSTVVAAESRERFIVEAKGNTKRAVERSDLTIVHDLDQIDVVVVKGAESDVKDLKAKYAPDIEFELDLPIEDTPVQVEETDQSATDEPLYPFQWDKQAQNIPEAQEVTRGEGTRVAIIDTGVAAEHPDLQHAVNVELSRNFTGDKFGAPGPYGGYHGTHVAGITAANDRNEVGVVGTAPGTEVVDCRVFSPGSLASFSDILAAIVYAAEIDCDAANMSIGAYPVPRQGLGKFYGKVLNSTTAYARRKGTLLVVSAGNAGADLQHDGGVISLPNEAANVLSISATGPVGFGWPIGDDPQFVAGIPIEDPIDLEKPTYTPAFYTNYGTNAINVAAPGGNIDTDILPALASEKDEKVPPAGWFYDLVLNSVAIPKFRYKQVPDGDDEDDKPDKKPVEYLGATYTYSWVAGTSMSAPQVTGAAALIRSVDPDLNTNQVQRTLENTATIPEGYDKSYYGAGVINPADAVRAASGHGRRGRGKSKGKAKGRGRGKGR